MTALVQLLIYAVLVDAALSVLGLSDFVIFTLITVIIAGSGYVINDYYDEEIDKVNKPKKWIVGNIWSRKEVLKLYFLLVSMGAVLSIFLAIRLSLFPFLFIYPIAIFGLWLYSYALKCMPIIGNLWVSLFCAGVVLVIALPDFLTDRQDAISPHLIYYAIFAFLTTWYREIVKDIEDVEGDKLVGCFTFPVRFGIMASKWLTLMIVAGLMFSIHQWSVIQTNIHMVYALNILQGCIITSAVLFWWAKDKKFYHLVSISIKVIMLLGTIALLML